MGYAAVITPNDSTTFVPTKAIYIGGTGNLNVRMAGDSTNVLFSALPVGTILPISVDRVLSTSTTATLIVAMW